MSRVKRQLAVSKSTWYTRRVHPRVEPGSKMRQTNPTSGDKITACPKSERGGHRARERRREIAAWTAECEANGVSRAEATYENQEQVPAATDRFTAGVLSSRLFGVE